MARGAMGNPTSWQPAWRGGWSTNHHPDNFWVCALDADMYSSYPGNRMLLRQSHLKPKSIISKNCRQNQRFPGSFPWTLKKKMRKKILHLTARGHVYETQDWSCAGPRVFAYLCENTSENVEKDSTFPHISLEFQKVSVPGCEFHLYF